MKINFVGAGPGAVDLITVRGKKLIEEADVIIYAGSLVNKDLLDFARAECEIFNSATMTLDQVIEVMAVNHRAGKQVVRLHTGDPSLYGAIKEQMRELDKLGIEYEVCPGVSACFGAAASINLEYTLPGISQSLIITRAAGRTEVPPLEGIKNFAAHKSTMAIYLSTGLLQQVQEDLIAGGYSSDTKAVIVYKATWPEEKIFYTTVGKLYKTADEYNIKNTALIIVGDVISTEKIEKSKLYSADFSTMYREAEK